ncbi:MAG: CDP-diacylglycerol--glycerol-3-phosphate 3-phosphatidyltransferase [Parvibaculales bacterium]
MMKNLPNILTIMRVVLIPAIYLSLICEPVLGLWSYWLAVGFYAVAGITDFFDGWLARKLDVQSGFGRMLDPIADKLMVAAVLVMLVENGTLQGVHMLAALIILSREILVSGLREYLIELRVGLPVSNLAKIKTTAQMVALGFLLSGPAGAQVLTIAPQTGLALLWIAALLTIYTGYDYLRIGVKHAPWRD